MSNDEASDAIAALSAITAKLPAMLDPETIKLLSKIEAALWNYQDARDRLDRIEMILVEPLPETFVADDNDDEYRKTL